MMRGGVARRPARLGQTASVTLPAPTGGVNAVDAASAMAPTDAVAAYNVTASELGVRSRLGFEEWVTGLPTAGYTLMPFAGNAQSGAQDRLFVALAAGIYDASSSTASPALSIAFGITTGDAGRGMSFVASTPGGRFLVYCDEENGLYVRSGLGAWAKTAGGVTQPWEASTFYVIGNQVVLGGNVYVCDTDGTSAASGGPSGAGTDIVDGTTRWDYVSAASATVIGPSLADQTLGFAADPDDFVFGTSWNSRLWFVEKNSTRAWYGDIQALYGTYTSFDFGSRMRHGGPLKALYTWDYDAGAGLRTHLVALSEAGDVVVYGGIDPADPSSFSIVGSYFAGGFPAGRTIATEDTAGELLIATKLGTLPASSLLRGGNVEDPRTYTSRKIAPLIARLADTNGAYKGWALHIHPADSCLLLLIPQGDNLPTTQWAQSFLGERGWFPYQGLPMVAAAVWNGRLFFTTPDGRVCVNEGYVDNVQLADPNTYTPVSWSVIHSFQTLGNAQQKRVHFLRVNLMTETANVPISVAPRFDYDFTEAPAPESVSSVTGALWDTAIWDEDEWGGDYGSTSRLWGASGIGRAVSVAIRGTSTGRTILMGTEVAFDQGGLL